jgi:ubiquitin carboxyl-terminal hydrolase 8
MLPPPSDAEVRASGRPLDESMTGPFRYDAYAVIRHLGTSIGHGHYVSLVKDRGRGRWRHFDDQKSSDFGEADVVMDDRVNEGGKAYIVFYERVGDLKSLSA